LKPHTLADYLSLTKPRLNLLAILTNLAGFLLGTTGSLSWRLLAFSLLGATLLAGGCGALNQWLEVEADKKMIRTKKRPLPAGRLSPHRAFWFGAALSGAGILVLLWQVNELTAFLGFCAFVSYVVLYTPLKKITSLCTAVGAVPGALPPLMGYAAASGATGLEGWTLFCILFFWQMPHFLAIGWIYRDDYKRAGFPMLAVRDPKGELTGLVAVVYAMALLPVSLLPVYLRMTGPVYFWIALVLSLAFVGFALALAKNRTLPQARRLFWASILYLPFLFTAMVLNKG
jgi:protoheme IX farnesyltransferase